MKTFKDSLPFPWKAETASLADIARHLYDRGNASHECILYRKQACSWLQHYQGVCFWRRWWCAPTFDMLNCLCEDLLPSRYGWVGSTELTAGSHGSGGVWHLASQIQCWERTLLNHAFARKQCSKSFLIEMLTFIPIKACLHRGDAKTSIAKICQDSLCWTWLVHRLLNHVIF